MCGSSARKLKRGRANLLGGRAWRFTLHPLTWPEIADFDLPRAVNRGLIPEHYDSRHHRRALAGYVDDYLKEEVLGREGDVAIEVKGGRRVRRPELRGLRAFVEEHRPRQAIVICNESAPRRTDEGIWILPWERFLERLWGDGVV